MAFSSLSILFVFSIGTAITYLVKYLSRQGSNARPLPPGPKGLPLVGNINDMPKPGEYEWDHWLKHKDIYGPISSVTVLGQPIIVINDAQIALEILRDKASTSAGRATMEFACNMVGLDQTIALCNDMDMLKKHRTNMAKVAGGAKSLKVAQEIQEAESAHFIVRVLESPEKLFEHMKMESGAVILKLTYGYNVNPHGKDRLVDMAGKVMDDFSEAATPGHWMVDVFPFLKHMPAWLPGTSFQRTAHTMTARLTQSVEEPFAFVKQQMAANTHKTSFMSQALETIGDTPEMQAIHKWSALSMYLGGADSTVSSLMVFFLAMMLFPDVQKRAQAELDQVLGDRLAVCADRDALPYIWATVLEIYRWHPIGPMGMPHTTSVEHVVRGYRVPKDAMVMTNVWWFMHDPDMYRDPMAFRPERFITTPTHKAEPDPRSWIFGYGRRICPGKLVADNALLVTVAQTLSVFNIEKPRDKEGRVVEPRVEFKAGLFSHPLPYEVSVKPRSKEHVERIRRAGEMYPWEESDAKTLEGVKW